MLSRIVISVPYRVRWPSRRQAPSGTFAQVLRTGSTAPAILGRRSAIRTELLPFRARAVGRGCGFWTDKEKLPDRVAIDIGAACYVPVGHRHEPVCSRVGGLRDSSIVWRLVSYLWKEELAIFKLQQYKDNLWVIAHYARQPWAVVVFLHGGGWVGGTPYQFDEAARDG